MGIQWYVFALIGMPLIMFTLPREAAQYPNQDARVSPSSLCIRRSRLTRGHVPLQNQRTGRNRLCPRCPSPSQQAASASSG
jgi:hypothetical protein